MGGLGCFWYTLHIIFCGALSKSTGCRVTSGLQSLTCQRQPKPPPALSLNIILESTGNIFFARTCRDWMFHSTSRSWIRSRGSLRAEHSRSGELLDSHRNKGFDELALRRFGFSSQQFLDDSDGGFKFKELGRADLALGDNFERVGLERSSSGGLASHPTIFSRTPIYNLEDFRQGLTLQELVEGGLKPSSS